MHDRSEESADELGAALKQRLERLRAAQRAQLPRSNQRREDLLRLRAEVVRRREALCAAASADFGRRSRHETLLADVSMTLHEIDYILRHLRRWLRPKRVAVDWKFLPARAEIRYQPLGVVGIMSPWNYPINLALMPLAAAIAAGNHVLLKPSEHTPRTSALIEELLRAVFPPERVDVVQGGPEVAARFAELPFDHLFFTGSTALGRQVMAAAARNLTPVTLELGGKSPAVIAPDYDFARAAKKLVPMKFLNAGQTCIAPDYVLVPAGREAELAAALEREIRSAYPSLADNPDYTSIVNERQYRRLLGYLEEARAAGAEVRSVQPEAESLDPAQRILPPTLVLGAGADLKLMQEEIFGPILPINAYEHLDHAYARIAAGDRPLALYHFDDDPVRTRRLLEGVVAGGVCVNDATLHFAQPELPFGGVGASGMGHYHGHHGFLTFSKAMPVFYQSRLSTIGWLRAPYRAFADRMIDWLSR